jgi:hypothetical protein
VSFPKRAVVIGGAVAVLAVAALVAYLIIGGGSGTTVTKADLRVGDCIESPPDGSPPSVERVGCNSPHKGEVYGVLALPESDEYPGDGAVHAFQENCSAEFTRYATNAPAGPTFDRSVITPTQETWAKGDRSLVCIATTEQDRSQSLRP